MSVIAGMLTCWDSAIAPSPSGWTVTLVWKITTAVYAITKNSVEISIYFYTIYQNVYQISIFSKFRKLCAKFTFFTKFRKLWVKLLFLQRWPKARDNLTWLPRIPWWAYTFSSNTCSSSTILFSIAPVGWFAFWCGRSTCYDQSFKCFSVCCGNWP